MYLCFCRAQCLVARTVLNTSVHSAIGAIQVCTDCEYMKAHTVDATRTGARFAAKDFNLLQACAVTWRSIQESLSSNVTFAAAGFVIHKISRDTFKRIIQRSTAEMCNI